ncbi:MAG: hypothetical protein ACYDB9_01700 [Gammaproteobacteria bacterium]
MKWKLLLVFLGLGTLACSSAFADDQAYNASWYIAPQYSYVWPDSKRGVANGSGWQLDIGKQVSDSWNVEFGVIDYKTNFNNGIPGSSHQTAYGLNGLWFFGGRYKAFAPFAEFGGGANDQRTSYNSSQTNGYGTAGLGFTTSPWDWNGALRFNVQYLRTFGNGNFGDTIAGIGLVIPF